METEGSPQSIEMIRIVSTEKTGQTTNPPQAVDLRGDEEENTNFHHLENTYSEDQQEKERKRKVKAKRNVT